MESVRFIFFFVLLPSLLAPACGPAHKSKIPAPNAPSGLLAAAVSSSQIGLSWLDNSTDETGFEIWRSPDGVTFRVVATAPVDATTYTDTGLFPNTPYWYQVRAVGSGPASAFTNVATAATNSMAWTRVTLAPASPSPSARATHTAVFGPAGSPQSNQMIVFGGIDSFGATLGDVWGLPLSGAGPYTWSPWTPTNPQPGRAFHTSIYDSSDPLNPRMIVFGGVDGFFSLYDNAVLALSLSGSPGWSTYKAASGAPVPPTFPTPRLYHAAIYDPVGRRLIVFGGDDGSGFPGSPKNDVWALPLTGASPSWTNLTPSSGPAPPGRSAPSAIYDGSDPLNPRMVIFGGNGFVSLLNDVWALSLSGVPAWTQLTPTGNPPPPAPAPRLWHTATYDATGKRMIIFGGQVNLTTGAVVNDVWVFRLIGSPAWMRATISPPLPASRYVHAAVYDGSNIPPRMVVFGGADATGTPLASPTELLWALGF